METIKFDAGKLKRGKKGKMITATVISQAQLDALNKQVSHPGRGYTYQCKDNGYRIYSKPGKEQYTWEWFAVPYGDTVITESAAKYMLCKIDNSKESAIAYRGKGFPDPGAKFYDQLRNCHWYEQGVPANGDELRIAIADGRVKDWSHFLKEAYLIAPVSKINNTPYDVTPYSNSGCKYPHHSFYDGKLVLNRNGVADAYRKAKAAGDLKGDAKRHIEMHLQELGLNMEEPITESGDLFVENMKPADWYELKQLPDMYQKLVKDLNQKIRDTINEVVKQPKWKGFNRPDILAEIERCYQDRWMGMTKIREPEPNRKNLHGWIFVNGAKQHWNFFDEYKDDSAFQQINVEMYEMLKEVHAKLVKEVDVKSFGVEFVFGGDPGDNIYQWELQFNKETAENVLKYIQKRSFVESAFDEVEAYVEAKALDIKGVADLLAKFKKPRDLHDWMKDNLKYGIVKNGKATNKISDAEFTKRWKLQSPMELINSKTGVCFDFTELTRAWANGNGTKAAHFFMEFKGEPNKPCHTFSIVEDSNDDVLWVEAAWEVWCVVKSFGTLSSALEFIVEEYKQRYGPEGAIVLHHMKEAPKYGITEAQYLEYARAGKVITLEKKIGIEVESVFIDPLEELLESKEDGWIGVDFDKTIAEYTTWKDGKLGAPIKAMVDRVKKWLKAGKKVKIFTARAASTNKDRDEEIKKIEAWCVENIGQKLEVTAEKDQLCVEIWDDRAVTVEGNTGKVLTEAGEKICKTCGEPRFFDSDCSCWNKVSEGWVKAHKEKEKKEENSNTEVEPKTGQLKWKLEATISENFKEIDNFIVEMNDWYANGGRDNDEVPPEEKVTWKCRTCGKHPDVCTCREDGKSYHDFRESPEIFKEVEGDTRSQAKQVMDHYEEKDKDDVRRKELYISFIEYCKSVRPKNTFGSIFDKDAFQLTYPFVPDEMRYFYRLANPLLCVIQDEMTWFACSELRTVNAQNTFFQTKFMIFAAVGDKLIVFDREDKTIREWVGPNIVPGSSGTSIADSFDQYLEQIIGKQIVSLPKEPEVEEVPGV